MTSNKIPASSKVWSILIINLLVCSWASAHLMKAQHGTLNFVDSGVYMVLSLPVTAFDSADQNHDGKLSEEEFNHHRGTMFDAVRQHVTLTQNGERLELQGIMLSPVLPHDDPKKPASQLTVMGRFALIDMGEGDTRDGDSDDVPKSDLQFEVGLYGNSPVERSLEITAKRKSENQYHTFELSAEKSKAVLFAGN